MKIVVLAESFSEQMGYATNFYPKALAEQGHEVHIITTNTQPYFSSPDYKSIFEKFIGPGIVSCSVKPWKGTTLHRLPYKLWPRRTVGIKGLMKTIIDLKPDIVHCMGLATELNYEVALLKPFMPFKYFFECHIHASVFPPFFVYFFTPERFLYSHAS